MDNTKLVKLSGGGILLYRKQKMKCTAINPGFVFGQFRDKYPEPTAHFCEHMLFQGTKNLTKEQFGKKQTEILPSLNAQTSVNRMRLYVFRSNKLLKEALELASDMLLNPVFSQKFVENEKGVIKQELVRRNSDSANQFGIEHNRTIRDHYNLSTQVLGTAEEIDSMDSKTLKKFHKEMAVRQNFVCAVASGYSLHKIKKLINKYFIDVMPSNPACSGDKSNPERYNFEKPGNMRISQFPIEKTTGRISINLGNCDEKDELTGILFGQMLSKFTVGDYKFKLREAGLVYSAGARLNFSKDFHSFEFNFVCSPENVNKIIDIIGGLLKLRRKTLYDDDFIKSIQKQEDYDEDEESVRKDWLSRNLFNEYLNAGTKFFKKKDREKRKKLYQSITSEDIRTFVQKYFSKPENIYVTIQTNQEKPNFYTYEQIQNILTDK